MLSRSAQSSFMPQQDALETARRANGCASHARGHQLKRDEHHVSLQEWHSLFSLPMTLLFTACFLAFFTADIVFGWEMYRVLNKMLFPASRSVALTLCMGVFINTVALVCSHALSQCLGGALARWRLLELMRRDHYPAEIALERMKKQKLNSWLTFIVLCSIYLLLIGVLGYVRIQLLHEEGNPYALEYTTLGWVIFLSLLEVATGIYLAPFSRWSHHGVYRYWHGHRYRQEQACTAALDQKVVQLLRYCPPAFRESALSKDVRDALTRFWHRSSDEGYCAPCKEAARSGPDAGHSDQMLPYSAA